MAAADVAVAVAVAVVAAAGIRAAGFAAAETAADWMRVRYRCFVSAAAVREKRLQLYRGYNPQ